MTTDWKALCAELAKVLAEEYGVQREFDSGEPLLGSGAIELLSRTRAYLAQPEPVGLTDEELETDFLCWYKDRYSTAYFGAVPLAVLIAWTQFALARWGRPTTPTETP